MRLITPDRNPASPFRSLDLGWWFGVTCWLDGSLLPSAEGAIDT
jgi:hypothetical protein